MLRRGKRTDAILKNMRQHSRNNSGDKQYADITLKPAATFRLVQSIYTKIVSSMPK